MPLTRSNDLLYDGQIYPLFIFGVDGMDDPPDPLVPPQPVPASTLAERPVSASVVQQSPSSRPVVVSYALPTPNTSLPPQTRLLSFAVSGTIASTSISTTAPTVSTSASPSSVLTSAPAAILTPTSRSIPVMTVLATSATTPLLLSTSSTHTSLPETSTVILTSTAFASPSTTSPPAKPRHQHVSPFYVALALGILIFLGTICASISWILRRRRKRREEVEGEMWIGHVLDDDPDDMKRGESPFELEKGGQESVWPGVGAGRGGAAYPGSPTLSSYQFRDAAGPVNGAFGMPPPGPPGHGFLPASHTHGFANIHPSRRHPSVLRRGAPMAIEYPHHGLDGGGLTFRQDPNGGLTFQPPPAAMATPNPYLGPVEEPSYPNPYDDVSPRRPAHSTTPSHYSYQGAGTLAVTNLMPGDISSRTSQTSLGRRLGPPGLDNRGPDTNPWRRYDGVESRSGAEPSEESRGWGATIRSGIYSAVGRIVGAPGEEDVERPRERERDRFTELVKRKRASRERWADSDGTSSEYDVKLEDQYRPDDDPDGSKVPAGATSRPKSRSELDEYTTNWRERLDERRQNMVPDSRGWIIEEETPDGSRGKIHIVSGARDRILRRLGSTATDMSSPTTAYSTDVDPVFTSAMTTRANTIATSRRDTTSTRWSGCRRRENSRNGVTRGRERQLSAASSDWGTSSMARTLGMELGRPARSPGPA